MRKRIRFTAVANTVAVMVCAAVSSNYVFADIGSADNNDTLIDTDQNANVAAQFFKSPPTLWTTESGLTTNAMFLLGELNSIEREGLDPERYHRSTLHELTEQQWHTGLRQPFNDLLATAFKQLVIDLGQGIVVPEQAQSAWFQPTRSIDADNAYLSLKLPGNTVEKVINQYRPHHALYDQLADALVEYRGYAAEGGWESTDSGPTLKLGMSDPRVTQIRRRLAITGELPTTVANEESVVYDKKMARAVRRFQARHGLVTDGFAGKKTIDALNITAAQRVDQIRINLERVRWLPRDLGERYVFTNIADFHLSVVNKGEEILEMPVVVGKNRFKTPVFSDEIESLVFNPTWTVPKSIMYRELLPRERRDPGYLQRNNFELIREESGSIVVREPDSLSPEDYAANPFRYTIRQKPGKRNALGATKFMFPNKYSVYLHDTPSKSLFSRNQRAFSHGCVRVSNPSALAETLLGFEGWTSRRIDRILDSGDTTRIALDEHVQNHIAYLTSWVDNRGKVQFRNDIYGHDEGLISALDNPRKVTWPASILAELDN